MNAKFAQIRAETLKLNRYIGLRAALTPSAMALGFLTQPWAMMERSIRALCVRDVDAKDGFMETTGRKPSSTTLSLTATEDDKGVFMKARVFVLLGFLCASAMSGPALAVSDFGGTIAFHKMGKTLGNRPVLAILWNPKRPGEVVPSVATIDARLFGAKPSVKDWFKENSGGNMAMVKAGVLGWYPSDKPGDHYWNENQATDTDGDGWLSGHAEKWTEAIRKADADFNYAVYDTNGDGVLGTDELGIIIVIPQNSPFGTNRGVVGRQAPTVEPLIVDGKRIDVIAEWYTGNPADFATPAHELSHLLIGAPDMYLDSPWKYSADTYSMMDDSWGTWHLDPFSKLKSGWLRFTAAIGTTEYSLKDIEKNQEAIILYDPRRGPGEYFILENRWKGSSYDAGAGGGYGIFDQGVAIWHILEQSALFPLVNPQPPDSWAVGDWGRNGILMVRRNGGVPLDDAKALFDTKGTIITSTSTLANLKWVDGTSSGFRVELLTGAANTMRLKITSPVGSRIHRGTASNTSSHLTYIDDPYTRNNSDNLIFITPNWNPSGSAGVYNDHPIGVWYDESVGQHSIFNQDFGTMSIGAAFNYRVEVATPKGPMLHTTTADNGTDNWTVINHPLANGKPNAVLQVTQNWNPNGVGGTYNNHNIGVWYDGARWAVFNQDLAEMPIDAAFNVRVGLGYVHKATPSNIIGHSTVLDNAQFNGKPGISILVTPNWNPGGVGGVYNDHPIGVWYNGSKWEIFNQDFGSMPAGAAFNVTLN